MNLIKKIFFGKPQENIIFLHLPKAGGTTLRHIFYDQYRHLRKDEIYTINRTKETPAFLNLPKETKEKIKVLVGHFPFGLHQELNVGFKYVTVVREPNERVISAYKYTKSLQHHDLYKTAEKMSLAKYLTETKVGWLENGQTKFIAGVKNFDLPCNEEIFLKAIENIDKKFIAIGVLERFDESILSFTKRLNWFSPKYSVKNVTTKKDIEITKKDIEVVNNNNVFDKRLYEYTNQKLTSDLEEV